MQAITVWNTVYIERAIQELRKHRKIDDALLSHTSPLGWWYIILTGDYDWGTDKHLKPGEFRSLRPVPQRQPAPPSSVRDQPSGDDANDSKASDVDT